MPLAETTTPYKAHGFHHHPTERPQMPLAETTVTRILTRDRSNECPTIYLFAIISKTNKFIKTDKRRYRIMSKIENREQYEWALSRLEALVDSVTEEMPDNDPQKIEYCLLSNLVADYSDEHFDLGTPTLQDCLKERMFELGYSQKEYKETYSTEMTCSRVSGEPEEKVRTAVMV